jgi:hypothetical protein
MTVAGGNGCANSQWFLFLDLKLLPLEKSNSSILSGVINDRNANQRCDGIGKFPTLSTPVAVWHSGRSLMRHTSMAYMATWQRFGFSDIHFVE